MSQITFLYLNYNTKATCSAQTLELLFSLIFSGESLKSPDGAKRSRNSKCERVKRKEKSVREKSTEEDGEREGK